ncbi:phage portal protein [Xanthomonas nasturtii]|nr:phage portal protein [Xanthomonas nasturtii]MEA9580964.1 phage portal protein [Xanthomonas nasturtii]
MCQQLLAHSWPRDSEAFYQLPGSQRGGAVSRTCRRRASQHPDARADMVPSDFNDPARNISQGVERNAWGRPAAYYVYKQHPGDSLS